MDTGHYQFIAIYAVVVAFVAAAANDYNPKWPAKKIAFWAGAFLPLIVFISIGGLFLLAMLSPAPQEPPKHEGNAFGFAIALLLAILSLLCATAGFVFAWVVVRFLRRK